LPRSDENPIRIDFCEEGKRSFVPSSLNRRSADQGCLQKMLAVPGVGWRSLFGNGDIAGKMVSVTTY